MQLLQGYRPKNRERNETKADWKRGSADLRMLLRSSRFTTRIEQFVLVRWHDNEYVYNTKTENIIATISHRNHSSRGLVRLREPSWYAPVIEYWAQKNGLRTLISSNIGRRTRRVQSNLGGRVLSHAEAATRHIDNLNAPSDRENALPGSFASLAEQIGDGYRGVAALPQGWGPTEHTTPSERPRDSRGRFISDADYTQSITYTPRAHSNET